MRFFEEDFDPVEVEEPAKLSALDSEVAEELRGLGASEDQIAFLDDLAASGMDIDDMVNDLVQELTSTSSADTSIPASPRHSPRAGKASQKMIFIEPGLLDDISDDDEDLSALLDEDEDDDEEEDDDAEGLLEETRPIGSLGEGASVAPAYSCKMDDGIHVYF